MVESYLPSLDEWSILYMPTRINSDNIEWKKQISNAFIRILYHLGIILKPQNNYLCELSKTHNNDNSEKVEV